MKAMVISSSQTMLAGALPRTISQKTHASVTDLSVRSWRRLEYPAKNPVALVLERDNDGVGAAATIAGAGAVRVVVGRFDRLAQCACRRDTRISAILGRNDRRARAATEKSQRFRQRERQQSWLQRHRIPPCRRAGAITEILRH